MYGPLEGDQIGETLSAQNSCVVLGAEAPLAQTPINLSTPDQAINLISSQTLSKKAWMQVCVQDFLSQDS